MIGVVIVVDVQRERTNHTSRDSVVMEYCCGWKKGQIKRSKNVDIRVQFV
jgi:hypothetical protein